MNTNHYDSGTILKDIIWALRHNRVDILKECQEQIESNDDEQILLQLGPQEYEDYHNSLDKTSIKKEVSRRNETRKA